MYKSILWRDKIFGVPAAKVNLFLKPRFRFPKMLAISQICTVSDNV